MARGQKIQGKRVAKKLTWRQLLELDGCARCGECMVWCPVYEQDKRECITARGKLRSLRNIIRDSIGQQEREEFLESLYECSACGQCHVVCPIRIDTPELWEQAREALVSSGIPQPDGQVKQLQTIKAFDNSFSKPKSERGLWSERAYQKGLLLKPLTLWTERITPVLYFAGCTASFDEQMQSVAVQSARLLQEAGVDFFILGNDEPCCASKLRRMGDPSFQEEALKRIELIAGLKVETVVVSCAGCYKGLYADYRSLWPKAQKVLHLTQFLDRLLTEKRLPFKYDVNKSVTYHDPCHLGRHNNVYDEPRRVLQSVPGIEFIEMPRHRAFSYCCGMGGGLKVANPEIQHKMAATRIREAESVGVDAIVTPCQTCVLGLQYGVKEISSKIEVYHLNEIMVRSICPDVCHNNIMQAFGYVNKEAL